jgi:hypothetical protein
MNGNLGDPSACKMVSQSLDSLYSPTGTSPRNVLLGIDEKVASFPSEFISGYVDQKKHCLILLFNTTVLTAIFGKRCVTQKAYDLFSFERFSLTSLLLS